MLNRQQTNPRVSAAQAASLAIAWAIIAGVAYLGLIKVAIKLVTSVTPWQGVPVDDGLFSVAHTQLGGSFAALSATAIAALPIAILATLALGILTRARPHFALTSALLIVAALIGLAGALSLFIALVVNVQNGVEFLVALATIALVSVLLRVQKFIRRFFGRSPGAASVLFVAVTLCYLILSNGANISSIVLTQVDIWLALLAFSIVFYCGVRLARLGRRIRATAPARARAR